MYLSTSDVVHDIDIDDNSQIQQRNTPPVTSNVSNVYFNYCLSF